MKERIKKFIALSLSCACLFAAFGVAGCAPEQPPAPTPPEDDRVIKEDTANSILRDRDFSQGFNVLGMSAGEDGRTIYRTFNYNNLADGEAVWELSQWEGKNNIVEAEEKIDGNVFTYQSGGKKFVYDRENAKITLAIDAEQEYDGPRVDGQGWVHMLIEQNFQKVYSVAEVEEINIGLDYCLTKFDRKMTDEEFNPNLHNAQLLWYITLTNMPETEGELDEFGIPENGVSGDYIWFGIPIVDYTRYGKFMDASLSYDAGTSHWICSVDSAEYLEDPVLLNERASFKYNIVPMFEETLEKVQSSGGMRNCKLENLYVTYMNFGWEVPGTFDVAVDIYDISIEAVTK